eukprot:Rmarinus@m.15545
MQVEVDEAMFEWEHCKENFQPSKTGHNVKKAKFGLSVRSDPVVQEREKWEQKLRDDLSDDPLALWIEYIKWTKETFASGGKASHILTLLERCTRQFQAESRYKNDLRYLKLWVSYADLCEKPLDIFKFLYSNGFGQKFSLFYEAWAITLERLRRFSDAEKVYEKGINRRSVPEDRLRKRYEDFQHRMAQRYLRDHKKAQSNVLFGENESTELREEAPDSRTVLGVLSHKKAKGSRLNTKRGGGLRETTAGSIPNAAFQPFIEDENARPPIGIFASDGSSGKGEWATLPTLAEQSKENTQLPQMWNKATLPRPFGRQHSQQSPPRPKRTAFEVFSDGTETVSESPVHKKPGLSIRAKGEVTEEEKLSHHPLTHFVLGKKGGTNANPTEKDRASPSCRADEPVKENLRSRDDAAPLASFTELKISQHRAKETEKDKEKEKAKEKAKENISAEANALSDTKNLAEKENPPPIETSESKPEKETSPATEVSAPKPSALPRAKLQVRPLPESTPKTRAATPEKVVEKKELVADVAEHKKAVPAPTATTATTTTTTTAAATTTTTTAEARPLASTSSSPDARSMTSKFVGVLRGKNVYLGFDPALVETDDGEPLSFEESRLAAYLASGKYALKKTDCKPEEAPGGIASPIVVETTAPVVTSFKAHVDSLPADSIESLHPAVVETSEFSIHQDGLSCDLQSPIPVGGTPKHVSSSPTVNTKFVLDDVYSMFCEPLNVVDEDDNQLVPLSSGGETTEQLLLLGQDASFPGGSPFGLNSRNTASEQTTAVAPFTPLTVPSPSPVPFSVYEDDGNTATITSIKHINTPTKTPLQLRTCETESHAGGVHADVVHVRSSPSAKQMEENVTESCKTPSRDTCAPELTLPASIATPPALGGSGNDMLPSIAECSVEYDSPVCVIGKAAPTENKLKKYVDPFSSEYSQTVVQALSHADHIKSGYREVQDEEMSGVASSLKVRAGSNIPLGSNTFAVESLIGTGAFAKVYRAYSNNNNAPSVNTESAPPPDAVALKVESPPCEREYYMIRSLRQRVQDEKKLLWFPDAFAIDIRQNQSLLTLELGPTLTLQGLLNLYLKRGMCMPEPLAIFLTIELLKIVESLHSADIIHADVKPDNLLIRNGESLDWEAWTVQGSAGWENKGLMLIDFGRSIDMRLLLPEQSRFVADNCTSAFRCVQMQTGEEWSYEVDTYGVLSTVHTLLHGKYMETEKDSKTGCWKTKSSLKRYWQTSIWSELFDTLLNTSLRSSQESVVTVRRLRNIFEDFLGNDAEMARELKKCYRKQNIMVMQEGLK